MAITKQWVNLPKDSKYVGDGIPDINRLDYLHFETQFKNADPALYKVKVIPTGSGNIKYSKKELKRHKPFDIRKSPAQLSTSAKSTVEQNAYLPPAGGNQYKVKAKYGKKTVESMNIIEVWRRLYYQVISMKGVPYLSSFTKFEDTFKDVKNKFYIEFIEKDNGRNKMKLVDTIYDSNGTTFSETDSVFRNEARKVYSIDNLRPYAVAVVFSNYIADPVETNFTDPLSRKIPSKLLSWGFNDEVTIDIIDKNGDSAYLWHALVKEHDKNKKWFISAVFQTTDGKKIKISPDDVTIDKTSPHGALGGYDRIKVQLGNIKKQYFSEIEGKIKLSLHVVDQGFTGGFSYTSLNLITIATKAWWDSTPTTDQEMLQILNHEMGHKIGMVAYGDINHKKNPDFTYKPMLPDAPKFLYGENRHVNNQGHLGPHCGNGAKYNNKTQNWTGSPTCVMFGSNGTATALAPEKFCPECQPVVRKLDLNGRILSGLKNTF